jgi:hypothetical protein
METAKFTARATGAMPTTPFLFLAKPIMVPPLSTEMRFSYLIESMT